ncbi:hypothetical protein Tco_0531514 [Tanacetum coccineum]
MHNNNHGRWFKKRLVHQCLEPGDIHNGDHVFIWYIDTETTMVRLSEKKKNKEHFLSEKEAIFLLLTGIGDDIYSTVDACKTANEM